MKKLLKLTALFLLFITASTSCNKNDDDNQVQASIIGKWNYTSAGEVVNGQEVLSAYDHSAGCNKDNFEFKADGTGIQTEYNSSCVPNTYLSTYTKVGDILTQTESGETFTSTILQLDETTLKIRYTESIGNTTITSLLILTRI